MGTAEAALEPSGLLAEVAARLHAWDEQGSIQADWPDDARLYEAAVRRTGWVPGLDILGGMARRALRNSEGSAPTVDGFVELAEALQMLDEWHAPLGQAAGAATKLTDEQEAALRRLLVDGGGYNTTGPFGTVIPIAAGGTCTHAPKTGVVAQLLHFTAYLPAKVAAGDPDDSSATSSRRIDVRYVAHSTRSGDPRGPLSDQPIVAIAPVLQDKADARVEYRASPERYGVTVCYDPARLERIVAIAIEGGADLLLMPEMAVNADHVETLASAIRRVSAAHRKAKGDPARLRYVIAGLAHSSGATGNNSIVVLDIGGRRVFEQEKLCRWNLKWYHQRNYGLVPACVAGTADLREDIPGGTQVYIADLEHLGRFLTLICADMDYDRPGDWLVGNIAIDWLHAPIMDKSIAWSAGKPKEQQPWIVQRAERAAENGVPKVVVTNSVLLTLLLNDYNGANPHPDFPVLDRCAIAFMMDAGHGPRRFRQLEATLPCVDPIVEIVRWPDGFAPFPPT